MITKIVPIKNSKDIRIPNHIFLINLDPAVGHEIKKPGHVLWV